MGVKGDNVGSSDGDTVGTLVVGEGVGARVIPNEANTQS